MNAREASCLTRMRHQASGQPSAAAHQAARLCSSRVTSGAAPALPTAACGGCRASMGLEGNVGLPSNSASQTAGRRAVLGVQVRLSPVDSAARGATAAASVGTHAHPADKRNLPDTAESHKERKVIHDDLLQTDSAVIVADDPHGSNSCGASSSTPQQRNRSSGGGSACRANESTSSNAIASATTMRTRRRGSRKVRGKSEGRPSRSASHGSISTSTSSSSIMPQRQVQGRLFRRRSSRRIISARQQRISFSVPQATPPQPLPDEGNSSCGSQSPERMPRDRQRLALRGDVAGRLQASLTRLQERQALQSKIRGLAKKLLDPQRSADLSQL